MLHDPRKTDDPFKISTLISWLECQPPEKRYHYGFPCQCLLAQYFTGRGYKRPYLSRVAVGEFCDITTESRRALPRGFDRIARAEPHTMGAALKRAREFAA